MYAADRTKFKRLVFKRDSGVCFCCGVDTIALAARLQAKHDDMQRRNKRGGTAWPSIWRRFLIRLGGRRLMQRWIRKQSLWDNDHVVPESISLSGVYDLENMQTLCLWCHKKKHGPGWEKRHREKR